MTQQWTTYYAQTTTGIIVEIPNNAAWTAAQAIAEVVRAVKAYETLVNLCVARGSEHEREVAIFYVGHIMADEEEDGYGLCRLSQPVRVCSLGTNRRNAGTFQLDLGHEAFEPWTVGIPDAGDFADATVLVAPAPDHTDYRHIRGRFELSVNGLPVSQEVAGQIPVKDFWPEWYAEMVGDDTAEEPGEPDPVAAEIDRLREALKARAMLMDEKVRAMSSLIKSDPTYRTTTKAISALVAAQKADKARLEALERGTDLASAPAAAAAPSLPEEPAPAPTPDAPAEPAGKQPRRRKQPDLQQVLDRTVLDGLAELGVTLSRATFDADHAGADVVFGCSKALSKSAAQKAQEMLAQIAPKGLRRPVSRTTVNRQTEFAVAVKL